MLNDLLSCSGQILKQNPLFFIMQDCVNQVKALFYLKVLLGINFPQSDKGPGKYISKTLQVETKHVSKSTFLTKILVNTTALKSQMIISQEK